MPTLDEIYGKYRNRSPYAASNDQPIPLDPNTMQPMQESNPGMLGNSAPRQGFGQQLASAGKQLLGNRDLALALLSNSGYSPQKRSLGEIVGTSFLQADQAKQGREDDAFKRQYMLAQIGAMQNRGQASPSSVQEYEYAKQQGYKGSYEEWRAKAQTDPADVATFKYWDSLDPQKKQDMLKLKRNVGSDYAIETINGVPTVVYKPAAGGPGMAGGTPLVTPLTNLPAQAAGASTIKGAETAGSAQATRQQAQINTGLDAADSLATVKRGIQLLDSVGTGGFENAKLRATQLFGITGADESELSANLGKAVLHQLRATFGAQFTEQEGQRLASIEAGFGKSTDGNKRLLGQAQKILDRAARRGLDAAESSGDKFTANEIRKSMEFSLDPDASKNGPKAGAVENGYRFKGGDASDPNNWTKL